MSIVPKNLINKLFNFKILSSFTHYITEFSFSFQTRNNASPHQQYTGSYYGSNKKIKDKKSPSSYFNGSISPNNSPITTSLPRSSRSDTVNCITGRQLSSHPIYFNNHHNQYHHNQHQQSQQQQYNSNNNQYGASPGGYYYSASPSLASSPPNISLFAGSKCYDAPSPTALPRPPIHWTSCSVAASRINAKSVDFSDNLKIMLNVQA